MVVVVKSARTVFIVVRSFVRCRWSRIALSASAPQKKRSRRILRFPLLVLFFSSLQHILLGDDFLPFFSFLGSIAIHGVGTDSIHFHLGPLTSRHHRYTTDYTTTTAISSPKNYHHNDNSNSNPPPSNNPPHDNTHIAIGSTRFPSRIPRPRKHRPSTTAQRRHQ